MEIRADGKVDVTRDEFTALRQDGWMCPVEAKAQEALMENYRQWFIKAEESRLDMRDLLKRLKSSTMDERCNGKIWDEVEAILLKRTFT